MTTFAHKPQKRSHLTANTPRLKVHTLQGVYDWLLALHKAGLGYHMDDDPMDIASFSTPLAKALDGDQTTAWQVCAAHGADIHLLNLVSLGEYSLGTSVEELDAHEADKDRLTALGVKA